MPLLPIAEKWAAFNWNVIEIDGNEDGAFKVVAVLKGVM